MQIGLPICSRYFARLLSIVSRRASLLRRKHSKARAFARTRRMRQIIAGHDSSFKNNDQYEVQNRCLKLQKLG
ncbi:hypothetical protein RESH_04089 [Rhodopirellula europaea SH398]|uniref:Uncharacterized protein n=1 Tax=Rhodopirellula europaea SH398 TaxID=1263868 RepID=M5SGQ3_9BACT|nr:hypothetical protein RESH_04089 [Rhodopirellula europaea SH398]